MKALDATPLRTAPHTRVSADNAERISKTPIDPTSQLRRMAREQWRKSDGDLARAAAAMARILAGRAALRRRFYEVGVEHLREALLGEAMRADRRAIWQAQEHDLESSNARVGALSRATARALMDYPLWGGRRLGDATREEILESATQYQQQGRHMIASARWQLAIAKLLKPKQIAGKVLTESTLARLHKEIVHA